jgi:NAD-dependent deacetylase
MAPIDARIVSALRSATRVAVLTGAGISAESGIPTFRDKQTGLWAKFDAAELATPDAFARDPALVWGWYEWRRAAVQRATPNPGHRAIAAIADRVPQFMLITQNVDDLHERAGNSQVLHLHGEISRPYCQRCREPFVYPEEPLHLPTEGMRIEPPRCVSCGACVRPGVVWFGERLPHEAWNRASAAVKHCEVFIVCGTSSVVQPAASLTEMAVDAGATTIQVDPNPTGADDIVTFNLRGAAGSVLPRLIEETWGSQR